LAVLVDPGAEKALDRGRSSETIFLVFLIWLFCGFSFSRFSNFSILRFRFFIFRSIGDREPDTAARGGRWRPLGPHHAPARTRRTSGLPTATTG
jgi:hypothetical protein